MNYREFLIDTPDGRTLEVATVGEPTGHTVLFHHGTPGAVNQMRLFAPLVEDGSLYMVTMSRAGYGRSSRLEGHDVASVVSDARAALDSLGRDDYVAVGWSGGGPHALACAALDVSRCRAAWSLAGVVPATLDFDWTEGMGPENVEEYALAKKGGPEYESVMELMGDVLGAVSGDDIVETFGGLLSEPDKAVLESDTLRESFAASMRKAFETGWRGFFDDNGVLMKEWGFDPTTIGVPIAVWFGDRDLSVPRTHGEWLIKNLPTASEHYYHGEGHFSLWANHFDELAAAINETYV